MSSKKSKLSESAKKKIKISVIVAIVILAVVIIGYNRFYSSKGEVAATVNGEPIMKEDVVKEYLKVPPEYRQIIDADAILQGMIVERLLIQEAEKTGIFTTDAEVDSYIQDLLESYGITEKNLTASLLANGATLDEFKAALKDRITVNKLVEETVFSGISVTESDAKLFYEKNKAQYSAPEQVRASHILVNTSEEAVSIRNKALGGAKFEDLAKQYSNCPSSAQGGDLGWFGRGQMVKEFEDAAFALAKTGDISPVVETQFGFHIIKLTGRKEGSVQPFEDVQDDVEAMLLQEKQKAALEVYTSQLESNADIQIFLKMKEEPNGTPISELIKNAKQEEVSEDASKLTGGATADTLSDSSLAKCLTLNQAMMFGSGSSSISNEQKALFGDDFADIIYIDCDSQKDTCRENKIISYPTWVISGKKYPGKYSLEKLAELSGCN